MNNLFYLAPVRATLIERAPEIQDTQSSEEENPPSGIAPVLSSIGNSDLSTNTAHQLVFSHVCE